MMDEMLEKIAALLRTVELNMTARDRVSFKFFIFSTGWRRLRIHTADNRSASQARDRGLEMNWLDEEPAKEVRNEWRRKTGTSHSQLFSCF